MVEGQKRDPSNRTAETDRQTGIITSCLAVIAFFTLTDRPSSARWLSEEEKALAVARVKVERVGTTEVLDTMDRKKFVRGLFSPVTLGTALIFGLTTIPGKPSVQSRLPLFADDTRSSVNM